LISKDAKPIVSVPKRLGRKEGERVENKIVIKI
jgi:hypothetical protein